MKVPKHPSDGLTAQKSLDVFSVAPKFINNFGLGYDPLGPFFIAWPVDFEGRSVEKQYFLGQLFTG